MDEYTEPITDADPGDETDATVDEPEAPAFDYEAPEFQHAVERAAEAQVNALLERYAQQGEGQDESGDDPYIQFMDQRMASYFDKRFGEFEPTIRQMEDAENQKLVDEWAGKIPALSEAQGLLPEDYEGESVANIAQFTASGHIGELESRYGRGERAVQQSLRQAGDQILSLVKAAHQAGYRARDAEWQARSGAREPSPRALDETMGVREELGIMETGEAWAARNGFE